MSLRISTLVLKISIITSIHRVAEGLKWNDECVQKNITLYSNIKHCCFESES